MSSSKATVPAASGSALPARTACEACRSRKLKCDGAAQCKRCLDDSRECVYAVRAPIGRPKKRKGHVQVQQQQQQQDSQSPVMKRSRSDAVVSRSTPLRCRSSSSSSPSLEVEAPPPPPTHTSPVSSSFGSPTTQLSTCESSTSTAPTTVTASPSLDNLAVAAFLKSLDSLEISSADGLTPSIIDAWPLVDHSAPLTHINPHSLSSDDATVLENVSYAVPADFSWWSPEWLAGLAPPPPQQQTSFNATAAAAAQSSATMRGPTLAPALTPPWPRGREAGMGGGEIRTAEGQVVHGVKWPAEATTSSDASDMPTHSSKGKEKQAEDSCALTGAPECCCTDKKLPKSSSSASATSASSSRTSRVHCVPNPSGKGCTCLCDVSVSLLNVRASLRTTASATQPVSQTLHLTLAASQAVAAQCACSADCPTCRSDPSTSLSAGLLISTALQIYARAVSTLRLALGGGSEGNEPDAIWDMKIGEYTPSARNARRIALFAMKLELRDLREAIGKVSWAAEGAATTTGADSLCINPVDQLVIRKLHQQLGEVLRTVEGME